MIDKTTSSSGEGPSVSHSSTGDASESLDEYVFDKLDPDDATLTKGMLAAVVDHPDIHANSFTVTPSMDGQRFRYFLAMHEGSNTGSPFAQQAGWYPRFIARHLQFLGVIESDPDPKRKGSPYRFTGAALAWHRRHGGPSVDDVRKVIGRHLLAMSASGLLPYDPESLAHQHHLTIGQVQAETHMLVGAGLIERHREIGTEFGFLQLSSPEGFRWAAAGYRPISELVSPTINVNVDLHVEVRNTIREAEAANVPRDVLDQFEVRLRRLEDELEEGEGSFDTVKDLIETANSSKDLLGPAIRFLYRHWDKIQTLGDEAIGHL